MSDIAEECLRVSTGRKELETFKRGFKIQLNTPERQTTKPFYYGTLYINLNHDGKVVAIET